jgi:hypothetical protein
VEIQDRDGASLPGYSLEECRSIIGNEIERTVAWNGGVSLRAIAGKPVRLRFFMKDADLYSIEFK